MGQVLPALLLMVLLCLMAGMGYLAFSGSGSSKRMTRRLDGLKERHSGSQIIAAQAQLRRIQHAQATRMDQVVKRVLPNPAQLHKRLEKTGKDWSVGQYGIAIGGIAFTFAMLLWLRGLPLALALLVGLFLGLAIPHFTVGFLIQRRIAQFTKRFPDAIDLLVRGLRSGLPISETMNVVAREIPGPVGIEFRRVTDKVKIGRTMEQALQETADRLGTPEFQFFVITLAIQRETGGNLAETLANLSDVLRKRSQMKLKIKAMSSESKASAYIVGSLPFIVFGLIWSINPSYMGGFLTDPRLMVTGGLGLVWMCIGAFIMAKMVSFEI